MSPLTLFWYVVSLGAGLFVWFLLAGLAYIVRAVYLAIVFTEGPTKTRPAGPSKRWQVEALIGIAATVAFSAGFMVIASLPGANVELAMPFICIPPLALAAALSSGWIKVRR